MTTPTLPADLRTPPAPDACYMCLNHRYCDFHWARQHIGEGECDCCAGRYSTCRNPTLVNSTPPAVHSIRRSNTEG